jgi:hypothetical protein
MKGTGSSDFIKEFYAKDVYKERYDFNSTNRMRFFYTNNRMIMHFYINTLIPLSACDIGKVSWRSSQTCKWSIKINSIRLMAVLLCASLLFSCTPINAQDYEKINNALVYDYNPTTKLGDKIFGTVVCDFEHDNPGRNSHGGPIALEYANSDLVAFHTNTDGHSINGWSEYTLSKDGGRTWKMYNKFKYSYDTYQLNPNRPAWVEEGLVTGKGTVVLFITHFKRPENSRTNSGFMRSYDNGATWTEYQPLDGSFVGYPASVAVDKDTSYVLFDTNGPHVLYVSTDDGKTWSKRSTLPLDDAKWYGAMCFMNDGRLLAGAYVGGDENHFFYCISKDKGLTWGEQKRAYVDKKIRDPEVACLDGKYYLHGRAGSSGEYGNCFVLYQSEDGENWGEGIIVSSEPNGPDGYSSNCIINKYKKDVPNELMVVYSILYEPYQKRNTNEYVFFIKPMPKSGPLNLTSGPGSK